MSKVPEEAQVSLLPPTADGYCPHEFCSRSPFEESTLLLLELLLGVSAVAFDDDYLELLAGILSMSPNKYIIFFNLIINYHQSKTSQN